VGSEPDTDLPSYLYQLSVRLSVAQLRDVAAQTSPRRKFQIKIESFPRAQLLQGNAKVSFECAVNVSSESVIGITFDQYFPDFDDPPIPHFRHRTGPSGFGKMELGFSSPAASVRELRTTGAFASFCG
jgi:hypothetical protein